MSAFFEIAYAAVSNRLCLFTGTGFSKSITGNAAPSWRGLLESCCEEFSSHALKESLFPVGMPAILSLEDAAQIIDIELKKSGKRIHTEICKRIQPLVLAGDNDVITRFFNDYSLTVVTTNYDKLAEALAEGKQHHSIAPGLPVPRSFAHTTVYHVHGSIDAPDNMVVTSEDYLKFINSETYFSRKLSTVLHENTVVILGYSLGDTNLKAIISDYKGFSNAQAVGGNLFFVSKDEVGQNLKDYYSYCYGMRVIDRTEIRDFFDKVNASIPRAKKTAEASRENLQKVLYQGHHFTDEYLKIESSLFEIVSAISALGKSFNDPVIVLTLAAIIEKKKSHTHLSGAWEQYEHLARWLVYLGSFVDLGLAAIKDIYLEAALHSMRTMSKSLSLGYSWHAYGAWNVGWSEIMVGNRTLIRNYILEKIPGDVDAVSIVERA